jgi:hypothetical protein
MILAASWFVCRWCVDRLDVRLTISARSLMGLIAFLVLLSAEFGLGAVLGRSLLDQVASYGSPTGALGLVLRQPCPIIAMKTTFPACSKTCCGGLLGAIVSLLQVIACKVCVPARIILRAAAGLGTNAKSCARQLLDGATSVFEGGGAAAADTASAAQVDVLYRQIGQLKVESDFLSRKLGK